MITSMSIFAIAIVPSMSYFEYNAAIILVPIGLITIYTVYMTESYKRRIMKEQNISNYCKLLSYIETQNKKMIPEAKLTQLKKWNTFVISILLICVVMLMSNMN